MWLIKPIRINNNKKNKKRILGLTMVEILATIIILSLIILALISTAYYIFISFEEISIKGIIRRKINEYYHTHIFTKYYLYDANLGDINSVSTTTTSITITSVNIDVSNESTTATLQINNSDEFKKRLNYYSNNFSINLASLFRDMIYAFNNDDWIKSQGIKINSVNATLVSTIGFYKRVGSELYLANTLDKLKVDFTFQKRNKKTFHMSFDFYIVNNMKNFMGSDDPHSTTTTNSGTLFNGPSVFSISTTTTRP